MCLYIQEVMKSIRAEKNTFKAEYERISTEYAIVMGHSNKKQKIHYVESLKSQLNTLLDENSALRNKLKK